MSFHYSTASMTWDGKLASGSKYHCASVLLHCEHSCRLFVLLSSTWRMKSNRSDLHYSAEGNEQCFILIGCLYTPSILSWHLGFIASQVIANLSHWANIVISPAGMVLSFTYDNDKIHFVFKITWMDKRLNSRGINQKEITLFISWLKDSHRNYVKHEPTNRINFVTLNEGESLCCAS